MKPSKKKPRIRNRPRNKANRQNRQLSESQNDETMLSTNESCEKELNSEIHDQDLLVESESEDEMPGLEDESKLFYKPEDDEALQKIEQWITDKKLKHQPLWAEKETYTKPDTSFQLCAAKDSVTKPDASFQEKEKITEMRSVLESTKGTLNTVVNVADVAKNTIQIPATTKFNDVNESVSEAATFKQANRQPKDKTVKLEIIPKKKEKETVIKAATPSRTSEVNTAKKAVPTEPVTAAKDSSLTVKHGNENIDEAMDTKVNPSLNQQHGTKVNASPNQKPVTSKRQPGGDSNNAEQNAFIQNIQKKMEAMLANGDENLPNTLMENLKKLLDQGPVSDIESDDDADEYIEYIYKPRKYFLVSLCNLCKCDLSLKSEMTQCLKCEMTYYCSVEHMQNDAEHRELCNGLQQVAAAEDGHIFQKCDDMSADQFRSFRIIAIRKVESQLNRRLTATEQEVILFPRLCMNAQCRKYKFDMLKDCPNCGMVAYCENHLSEDHKNWCPSYQLFKEFVMFQEQFGKLEPSLPTKLLKDTPLSCNTTKQIFCKLGFGTKDLPFGCEYAALTQISTAPLTAWYALKLSEQLNLHQDLTIHLIGAEIEFEVDVLQKWELFFLHITPTVKNLNVVFVGPELNPNNILLDQFQKTKCCVGCRKNNRSVKYFFESSIYHDYSKSENFLKPNLICFFNAGLYRSTGYNMEDTWPETIAAASNLLAPIVVTAYTEYEAPLDMQRFVEESQRNLKIIQIPVENPFGSVKPERNFISDHEAPLMFKNYFFFVMK